MAKPVPNPTSRLRDRLDYHKARRETRTIEHLIDMTCRDFDQIFAAAESGLGASAALERARAAERERCAKIAADRIIAAILGDLDADLRSIAGSIDHDIRALGPVPRPSPEAEAPKESATKWLAVNFRKRAQALRVAAEHGESPAAWHAAAETYETAAGVAERWRPTPGAVEATTAPALAPEMRERVRKLLAMPANIDTWMTYCIEAHDILSALFPQTDGGAK